MNKPFLLLDADEVALQWLPAFTNYVQFELRMKVSNDAPKYWDLTHWMGVDKEEVNRLIVQFNESEHFENLKPMPGATLNLITLASKYDPIVITACSNKQEVKDRRIKNLTNVFGNIFKDIICVDLKQSKKETLKKFDSSWWIEDKFTSAEDGLEVGHKPIIFTQPHNKGWGRPGIVRCNHWYEIYHYIISDGKNKPIINANEW